MEKVENYTKNDKKIQDINKIKFLTKSLKNAQPLRACLRGCKKGGKSGKKGGKKGGKIFKKVEL